MLALLIFASFSLLLDRAGYFRSARHHFLFPDFDRPVRSGGVAGTNQATCAGKAGGRDCGRWTTGASLALLLASWGMIAFLPRSISLMLVVFLLDLAVQAVHVTNLGVVVGLRPHWERSADPGLRDLFYSVGSAAGDAAGDLCAVRRCGDHVWSRFLAVSRWRCGSPAAFWRAPPGRCCVS